MDKHFWHDSYASGVEPSISFEQLTVSQGLSRSAGLFPDHPALIYMGKRITYRQLNGMVNSIARALQSMGIQQGDHVAVCLPNIPEVVIATHAVFRIGAVVVQANPLYTEPELAYQLDDSDAKAIITLSLLVPRIQSIQSKTKIKKIIACHIHGFLPFLKKQLFPFIKRDMVRKVTSNDEIKDFGRLLKAFSHDHLDDLSEWEGLGALLYTGGTTGVSKGVMLHHANMSYSVQILASWFPDLDKGKETLVGNFPVFHTAGFTILNFVLWQGFNYILIPRPDASVNVEAIRKYHPTFLPGVPTIFTGLLNDQTFRNMNLSFIKGFISGAAPLAPEIIDDLHRLTGGYMCEAYGATETTPLVCMTPWGGKIKPGTVGCPVPNTEVKIVDAATGVKAVEIGEVGEIAIKGPQVMKGYYKKPEETEKALRDGWFYSGDIGRLDKDGYLTIVDRKKDIIIAGGYNIYPVEVDNVLFEHPKVLEACTVGVPDDYRGETVKAFIVVKPGNTLSHNELNDFCRERLAAYKVPKIYKFVEDLPKSAVGKILRKELRKSEVQRKMKSA